LKIAVISDIHSNLEAFKAVLKAIGKVDKILFLGDFVGYGAKPNEVIQIANELKIISVMGNHDYASITDDTLGFNPYAAVAAHWTHKHLLEESKKFLNTLPLTANFKINGYSLLLVHGSPSDPLNEYIFPGADEHLLSGFLKKAYADVLLLGHTHIAMLIKLKEGYILNPGGVGQPRDLNPKANYAIISEKNGDLSFKHHRVEYNVDKTAKEILAAGLPPVLAERLYYGW
jgi:putative phosphoesterase